jgi:hypothetical protein
MYGANEVVEDRIHSWETLAIKGEVRKQIDCQEKGKG